VWATDEVAACFGPGDHGSTYAGQPLALSAARATLAVLEAMDAPSVVAGKEQEVRALLAELPGVDHVRGRGLLLGIELSPEGLAGRTGAEVARACLDRGLILNGITPTALRIAPPYTISDEHLAEGVGIIADVLADRPEEA